MRDRPRTEIRISGSGGQGIILAATVLAEAAVAGGCEVMQTQSYGPEARGGASLAEVIVDDDPIDFPEVTAPDVTLCLNQEAFDTWATETRAGGLVIYDEHLVDPRPLAGVRLLGAPFGELAERRLGKAIAANMVALGTLQAATRVVGRRALSAALRARMPQHLVDLNLRALRLGFELRPTRTAAPRRGRGARS